MSQLDKMKRRLGIEDTLQDDLLTDLIEDSEGYFLSLTGAGAIDPMYNFMILDVALKLYNRKGSEGMQSESVDGYSATYAGNLFEDYMDILNRDFDLDSRHRKRGKVRFI